MQIFQIDLVHFTTRVPESATRVPHERQKYEIAETRAIQVRHECHTKKSLILSMEGWSKEV